MALRRQHAANATRVVADRRKIVAADNTNTTTTPSTTTTTTLPTTTTTSAQKRKSFLSQQDKEKPASYECTRAVFDLQTIEEIVSHVLCIVCVTQRMKVKFTHHQIDTYVLVKCECGHVISDTQKNARVKTKNFHPLTFLFVYCIKLLGAGYSGANSLLSYLSLKHFEYRTYIRYAKYIVKHVVEHARCVMDKCRAAVCAEKQDLESYAVGAF